MTTTDLSLDPTEDSAPTDDSEWTDDSGGTENPGWTGPPHRWQPSRAGLVSLWRYWDETFELYHGRLLLRGPNGSGKSMALELLLPFLLDADASPNRLTSASKSRGGLYERVMTGTDEPNRAGFAWVEFRRGVECFTVGARVRASSSTRKTDLDFFTTTQSVGHDLLLLDEQRVALSRKSLIEAIGDRGRVHGSADDHRTAVRATLFPGFSADRYSSVITALLALRKEKLSQNLDLAKLSEVLSEALPPIDDHDLAVVAEGFERLDRRRAELARLETELEEVHALGNGQRNYAQAVVAGVADAVITAETARDRVSRNEREAKDALAQVATEADATSAAVITLADRLDVVDVEIDALKASDAYRDGASLYDLRTEVEGLHRRSTRDGEHARQRTADAAQSAARLDRSTGDLAAADGDLATSTTTLRETSVSLAAEGLADQIQSVGDADEGETLAQAWLRSRRMLIAEVRTALGAYDRAVQERTHAEQAVEADEVTVEDRRAGRLVRMAELEQANQTFAAELHHWISGCAAIGPDRVRAAMPAPPFQPELVTAAVARLAGDIRAELAVERRDLSFEREGIETERRRLTNERQEVADGGLVDPPSPAWRSARTDRGRAGAPLWQLVDVAAVAATTGTATNTSSDPATNFDSGADGGAESVIDRLEAALDAAGLLDAWVTPDGTVDLPLDHADVALSTGTAVEGSLLDWLTPLPENEPASGSSRQTPGAAPVPTDVVAAVLGAIAVRPSAHGPALRSDIEPAIAAPAEAGVVIGSVVIGMDGTFQLGTAFGRGASRPASLLGAAARERRRLARLVELDEALAACELEIARIDRALDDLTRRAEAVDTNLATAPDGVAVTAAIIALEVALSRLVDAEQRLHAARQRLSEAEAKVRDARQALTAVGSRHQLPTDAAGLDQVETALGQLEQAVRSWCRRSREVAHAMRALEAVTEEVAGARARADEAATVAAESGRLLAEREGKLRTLESSIGDTYEAVLGRIGTLDAERHEGKDHLRGLRENQAALERKRGGLETAVTEAEQVRARADQDRAEAHVRFVAAITDGLVDDAGQSRPEALDGLTAVLLAARRTAAELPAAASDPQAEERRSARVEERMHHAQGLLGGRVDLARELSDQGWWVLRAAVAGVRRRIDELAASLAAELATGRAELAADEERLFEQTLAGSVRRALADRIRLANRLVDGINVQLAKVRTAAGGVQVRLRWEVDPEQLDAVKSARALLLRDPADLTDDERVSLQDFVRARVDQARAELEANAPWEARLRETLDYRTWHRFTLQLGHRDWEGFQPATAKRLQRLSTGERSVALHLPMLASIAAHYTDEHGEPAACPRLILLDELFAGVDAANRAQLFGTFTAWDLDAVFTSDHEWCQYASLDGIAIHHLHPPSGDEPVTSTRFTWDGRVRSIQPVRE